MIETTRLVIADRQPEDIVAEVNNLALHPELQHLDPIIGETSNIVFYSIFVREEADKHIGTCCLYDFTNTEVELGIRIFIPQYWSRGYGTEVVNALCEHVFNCFSPITTVLAKTPAYNIRAIRCYEKCGFTQYSQAPVEGYDMVYMRRSRDNGK